MFYRIGKIKCNPGKTDDVINYFREKENFFADTDGIVSLSYFKCGENEVSGIAIWKSQAILESNAERVQSVMSGLMEFVSGPPEIVEGELEYQFKGK